MSPAADVEVPKEIQGFMTRSRNVTSGPFHLSCRSLHQAVSDLHAMVHLPEVFFPDEVEDKIYFVSADSRKVEDCALLQQIRLVENLAEGVLRRYHAAPCFQTMLVSCVTELEFSMGVVNRVFQDEYLTRYLLEYIAEDDIPENIRVTTDSFEVVRLYLEHDLCPKIGVFYDSCKNFITENHPERLQTVDRASKNNYRGVESALRDQAIRRMCNSPRQNCKKNYNACSSSANRSQKELRLKQPHDRRGQRGGRRLMRAKSGEL
jgi:hypothetical protein